VSLPLWPKLWLGVVEAALGEVVVSLVVALVAVLALVVVEG
jgi:hypothetical protein